MTMTKEHRNELNAELNILNIAVNAAVEAQDQAQRVFNALKPRARQVAKLLVSGFETDKDIAAAMGLAVCSVHFYITELFNATGMDSRVGLALYIVRRPALEALFMAVPIIPAQKRRCGGTSQEQAAIAVAERAGV